jgi:hypothetical protein
LFPISFLLSALFSFSVDAYSTQLENSTFPLLYSPYFFFNLLALFWFLMTDACKIEKKEQRYKRNMRILVKKKKH